MNESIKFPEEKIPVICRVIRRGLMQEKDREVKTQLRKQVQELEKYWKDLQSDDHGGK